MMKKLFFCTLTLTSFLSGARTSQEKFLQANKLYAQELYADAGQLYQEINHKGWAAWYNAGNCAYKLEDFAKARVCWRNAQMRCTQPDKMRMIMHNLAVIDNEPLSWWQRSVQVHSDSLTLVRVQLLFLLAWLLLLAVLKWWRRRRVVVGLLLLLVSILGTLMVYVAWRQRDPYALVIKSADLFVGPNENFNAQATLDAQTEVTILAQRDAWCKVRAGTLTGWLTNDSLALIDDGA